MQYWSRIRRHCFERGNLPLALFKMMVMVMVMATMVTMITIMVRMTIPLGWRQASAYSGLKLSALLVGEIAAPASIIERMVTIVLLVSHILTM